MTHRSRLVEHFARVCAERPTDTAIWSLPDDSALTFGELWQDFLGRREALHAAGVAPRSSVVSYIGNRPEFLTTLLAALDNGAVVLSLDGTSTSTEVCALAERFAVAGVMAPRGALPGVPSTALAGPDVCYFRPVSDPAQTGISHPAIFKITSGSDGQPKAVSCTEDNLIADGLQILDAMEIGPADISLGVIPMSHSYGLGNLLMPLVLQGSGLALRHSFVPTCFFDDIKTAGATVFPGVPFMFDYLRQHPPGAKAPSLRLLVSAAAPIRYGVVEAVKRDLGLKIHSFYGTSETGGIAYDASERIEDPVPMGHAMPGVTLTLCPLDDGEPQTGRVHVRSKAVASGYASPTGVEESPDFSGGGFLTGDLGRFDGDRQLILTGRVSQFVNVAGKKVHPEEVERALHQMPQIEAVSVVGIPCETRGEVLVACIVAGAFQPLKVSAVRRHCADRLSVYKIPRHYLFVDTLPIDGRGKVDLQAVKALAVAATHP